jgi:hypothetical protein
MSPTSTSSFETRDVRLKSASAPGDDAAVARIMDEPILTNLLLEMLSFSGMA